jgi:hypothetical protein
MYYQPASDHEQPLPKVWDDLPDIPASLRYCTELQLRPNIPDRREDCYARRAPRTPYANLLVEERDAYQGSGHSRVLTDQCMCSTLGYVTLALEWLRYLAWLA